MENPKTEEITKMKENDKTNNNGIENDKYNKKVKDRKEIESKNTVEDNENKVENKDFNQDVERDAYNLNQDNVDTEKKQIKVNEIVDEVKDSGKIAL